ncbi:XRE family transcriptional regulator [Aliarcobacter cryaerophilus]|uniref:XRE family transcriptional regulator n=1 Tax=Aliarcobacter cryaerophilus TaxID=28198 RepID=UPI003BAE5118
MDREEFNTLLEKANLTKKEFCKIIDLNYSTVNTWGSSSINIPKWVKSWLENYIKAKDMDKVVEAVKPYVGEK